MSKQNTLLKINVRSLTPEGFSFSGEVSAADLDIQDEDRLTVAAPISLSLHANMVQTSVLCQGSASTTFRCRCDRCLTYYTQTISGIGICHLYENPQLEVIDLTADVREDILLAFPQWTVCRDDCRGLCASCGQNLNVRTCSCHQAAAGESPWGALDHLKLSDGGQQ